MTLLVVVLKLGPARQVDLGLEPIRVKEKMRKEKLGVTRRVDPATQSRPGCKPVDFCFFY
jgi:hypothetical protein